MASECDIFSTPSKYTDMTILVEHRRLYANKSVLTLISPVWDAMIHADKDNGTTTELELVLPDKRASDVVLLLKCTYPSLVKPVTEDNIDILLPLAEEFQIQSLKNRCENFIVGFLKQSKDVSSKSLIHMLILSDTYDLTCSRALCTDMATRQNFNEMKKEREFANIRDEVKYQFMSKRLERYDGVHAQVCTWSQQV